MMKHTTRAAFIAIAIWTITTGEPLAASPPAQPEADTIAAPSAWPTIVLTSADQFRPPASPRSTPAFRSATSEVSVRQPGATPGAQSRVAARDEGLLTRPWTEVLLKKIVQYDLSPVRAARAIALVHVAMSDAIAACWDAKYAHADGTPMHDQADATSPVVRPEVPSYPSEHATVAASAATVLSYLFPVDTSMFRRLAQEAGDSLVAAGENASEDVIAGRVLGDRVGAEVVRRGKQDGSDQSYRLTVPQGPGYWKPPLVGMAADPTAGSWRPWVLASGADVTLPPPPPPGSPEYQADIDEMVAVAQHLTDEQRAIARKWSDGPGTITPAGHWLQIAEQHISRAYVHDPPRAARALALVSVAMADAFIACWHAKYLYWTARPNQVIADFTSYIKTPPFPGYPSGHSTQSAAAAEVLAWLFHDQASAFRALAEESAISRLYGGIHFSSDNTHGVLLGREVGRRVVVAAAGPMAVLSEPGPVDATHRRAR